MTPDLFYYAVSFDKFTYIAKRTSLILPGSRDRLIYRIRSEKYGGDAAPGPVPAEKSSDPENSISIPTPSTTKDNWPPARSTLPVSCRKPDPHQRYRTSRQRRLRRTLVPLQQRKNRRLARKRDTIIDQSPLFSWIFLFHSSCSSHWCSSFP